jgi:hypothetical protein
MKSIRDRIKLTFWGGVLILSLACVAMAATTAAPTDQPSSRKGGQAGQEVHSEKRSVETGRARVGGQAGDETPLDERTTKYGAVEGKRVGGQAGEESDPKKTESNTKSRAK